MSTRTATEWDQWGDAPRHAAHGKGATIVGGELFDAEIVDVLTCPVDEFFAQLQGVYPDWQAFQEWMQAKQEAGVIVYD